MAENDACCVYVDSKVRFSPAVAERIAQEYKNRIALNIIGAFGGYYPEDRLVILLMDIVDGYSGQGDTYIAGYFSMKDVFPKRLIGNSNEMPMLYIDINPGSPNRSDFYPTIAHELQHLINFSSRLEKKNPDFAGINTQPELDALIESVQQDDWVDEGLSSAAEYIYNKAAGNNSAGKGHIQAKIDYYNQADDNFAGNESNIAAGNNFFTWGEDDKFVYDDYITVYLFFQWLRIHAENGADIYRSIAESEYADYRAVTDAARRHIPGFFGDTELADEQAWELLLETWLAANYINAPEKEAPGGFFGYNGEFTLRPAVLTPAMLAPLVSDGKTISLYPGEGVYSYLGGGTFGYPPASPANIRYAGLDTAGSLSRITQGSPGAGKALLTFNANPQAGAGGETGALTGKEIPPAEKTAPGRVTGMPAEPRPIDIRPPVRF
ncbi:MAG: hypothetical protein LBH15_01500 [Treponema sp.]|nr:hypothetical protein [Treponema sp.]